MATSYKDIKFEDISSIRLIMADVDGTLNDGSDMVLPEVIDAIHELEFNGILMGLASGRSDAMLRKIANLLQIKGPVIAENGAVARLSPNSDLLDLGYSRKPAIEALTKLKDLYPGQVKERWDNSQRMIDIVFQIDNVSIGELEALLPDVQVLDSKYIMHLMQKGISKGATLLKLLSLLPDGNLNKEQVLVFGDSSTDLSLFEIFPYSILVRNPLIPIEEGHVLEERARFISNLEQGRGFAEVIQHILSLISIR